MKLDLIEILIILTYSSILIEIVFFPVPSVASSFQLIVRKKTLPENFLYTKVQNFNAWKKIVFLAIPTLLSLVAFCFPLILIMLAKFSSLMINKTEKLELIIIAFLLIFAGRTISLYSVMSIRKNNRQTGDSFELKTSKIFSFSRNPILLGTYLTYIGMIILLPHWFLLITFAVFFIHMHFRILIEESFLKFKFGDKYASYLERTKRYFLMNMQNSAEQNKVKDWFNNTYHQRKFSYLRPVEAYEIFIALLNPAKGQKLLDVACGPGLLLKKAFERGIQVFGIDISEIAIKLSKSFVPGAETKLGNAENLPFSDSEFDYVTCIGSLERFINTEQSLNEMKRVAKPEATFCFMVRNSETVVWKVYRQFLKQKNSKAHMEAKNLTEWKNLFKSNGFEIVSVYPDQWVAFRLRRKIFFWKKVDYGKLQKTNLPLKYSNEFIFILKKA